MTLNSSGESYEQEPTFPDLNVNIGDSTRMTDEITSLENTEILQQVSSGVMLTKEQQIEAMAKRFQAHGLTPEDVRNLSLWETSNGRERDTKPKRDKQKKKARSKIQQQSRRKNRK